MSAGKGVLPKDPPVLPPEPELLAALTLATNADAVTAEALEMQCQATKNIDLWCKNPQFMLFLLRVIQEHDSSTTRQFCAILLRKRLPKFWSLYPESTRKEIYGLIDSRLSQETDRTAGRSVAALLVQVLAMEKGANATAAIRVVESLIERGQPLSTELGFLILAEAVESRLTAEEPVAALVSLVLKGLQVEDIETLLTVYDATLCLVEEIDEDEDAVALREMLQPLFLSYLRISADSSRREEALSRFLAILLEIQDNAVTFTDQMLVESAQLVLQVARLEDITPGTRDQALHFLHWIAKNRPKFITEHNLLQPMFDVIFPLSCHILDAPQTEEDEDAEDDDEVKIWHVGTQAMDSLALNLPHGVVYPIARNYLYPILQGNDARAKAGALVLIGIMAEGCRDSMCEDLESFVPPVLQTLQDPNRAIVSTALLCIRFLTQHLYPSLSIFNEVLMESLIALSQKVASDDFLMAKIVSAIAGIADGVSKELAAKYAPMIVPMLVERVQSSSSPGLKSDCILAIGAFAQASEANFVPLAAPVLTLLHSFVNASMGSLIKLETKQVEVLNSAIMTVGRIAASMPVEEFIHYREQFVAAVLKLLKHEQVDSLIGTRFACYSFFEYLLGVLGNSAVPLLGDLVPLAIASILRSAPEAFINAIKGEDKDDDAKDDDDDYETDDEDEDGSDFLAATQGFIEESEEAVALLTAVFKYVDAEHLSEYFEAITQKLPEFKKCFSPQVQRSIADLIYCMILSLYTVFPSAWTHRSPAIERKPFAALVSPHVNLEARDRGWIPGVPAQSPLSSAVMSLWEACLPYLHFMLESHMTTAVEGSAFAIGGLLQVMGPALLTSEACDKYALFIEQVFLGRHACQKAGAGRFEEDEDGRELEYSLFEGIAELFEGLLLSLGPQGLPFLQKMHPVLLKMVRHPKSRFYNHIGIGTYGSAAHECFQPFFEEILPDVMSGVTQCGVTQNELSLKCTSLHCFGQMVEHIYHKSVALQQQVNPFLEVVYAYLNSPESKVFKEEDRAARDNALSAVGKIIRAVPAGSLPVENITKVFLTKLPLVEDFVEVSPILKTLMYMRKQPEYQSVIQEYLHQFLHVMVAELAHAKSVLPVELLQDIKGFVQILGNDPASRETLEQIINLDAEYKEALQTLTERISV